MASMDELLEVPGVIVAFEFAQDGQLIAYRARVDIPQDIAALTTQFCQAVCAMFNALATAYSRESPMSWLPQEGWAYSGGSWTVAVGRSGDHWHGVFCETSKGDYNSLYATLIAEREPSRVTPWPWAE
jgi:roadblock/LC7 domain-containing protein